jgi:hypothetical protein
MITYDKSRGMWDFTKADEDEKEAMMDLAEKVWAHALASSIAKQMMASADVPGHDFQYEMKVN